MTVRTVLEMGTPAGCRPIERHVLDQHGWRALLAALAEEPAAAFLGLWADTTHVHALLLADGPALVSVPVEAGLYAALSPVRPAATLFERTVGDLWGHQAADTLDTRPWLDHGAWPLLRPLSDRPVPNGGPPEVPEMRPVPGEMLACGPLPPGFGVPGHWRFGLTADGVAQAEARLGYTHRGVLGLLRGKSPTGAAARLVARIDGAATVAHSTAFARAVEAGLGVAPPPRAALLREVMGAVERVAVTLHDLVEAAGGRAPSLVQARADLLAASADAFGHRLMMDAVRPGGLGPEPAAATLAQLADALRAVPPLHPEGMADGVLPLTDALSLQLPGAAGRASGRPDPLDPHAPLAQAGTDAARLRLRAAGVAADVAAALQALEAVPDGAVLVPLPHDAAEGIGFAVGPVGAVWHWVRLSGGAVGAAFVLDPAWHALPAFEAACTGSAARRLPALAAGFGLRTAGMEL